MKYEVKFRQVNKSGKIFEDNIIATEIQMSRREGSDAIKVLPEGKNRYKWYEIPTDYQMTKYFESWELTIAEATTGKNVYKLTR